MPDPVYEATLAALDDQVDPTRFEECAVALLGEYYPSLRPVPKHHDAGQDGLGELPDGTRFFLAATTAKDYRRNLFKSVNSHLKAGGERRAVVLATSRSVSGQEREKLRSALREKTGFYLLDVHDRGDFAHLLYRHPQWRKDLLGVHGVAGALSRFPATSRPTPAISLVGRNDELEALRTADGDLLILGKAGIGKTFLLHELVEGGWGLFDTGRSLSDLEDAIREMDPPRIVIDDAHFGPERIAEVCRLRKEMDADFALVATSWPGQKDKVGGAFPEQPPILSIEELDRDQILEIINAVGIAGPEELLWQLIFQAHGRPGLAVTLARACMSGGVEDVVWGETLLKDVVGWYEHTLGEKTRHVLGFLALAGATGATLEQAVSFLGTDLPEVNGMVRSLALGGTIDEATPFQPERLVVHPEALRYPLVRDMFFGGPGSPDIKGALATLPNASVASFPLVAAALAGAAVDRAWLAEIGDWSDERFASHFAVLGPREMRVALAQAPAHLTAIAKEAYSRGIDREHALWVLMEFAATHPSAPPWGIEPPLDSVGAMLHRHEGSIEERRLAIRLADMWLQERRDTSIALAVLSHAMRPETSGTSNKPGSADVMTISAAVLPKHKMETLADMWDAVLDVVEREHPANFGTVLGMVHPWVFPGTLAMGRGPNPDVLNVMHTAVKPVIQRLADKYAGSWVSMHRLRPLAQECGVEVSIPEPFATMFPTDPWDGDYQSWEQEIVASVHSLAEALSHHPIQEVAKLIATAETEASEAAINWPRLTPQLVRKLAPIAENPQALLRALEEEGVPSDLLAEVLNCLADKEPSVLEPELERLLTSPNTAAAATGVALMHPVSRDLKEQAISQMTAGSYNFDGPAIRNELDHETLGLLLSAPDREVAWRMALALWGWRHGEALSGLPEELRQQSRDLIVNHPAEDHLYQSLFKQAPDILVDWLRAWPKRLSADPMEMLPMHMDEAIADLPVETRLDLLAGLPGGVHLDERVFTQLVSSNLSTARALFDRSELERFHGAALRGDLGQAWMDRALLALDYGWSPERIVFQPSMGGVTFSGEASDHWQQRIDAFNALQTKGSHREADRERIVAAGIELYEARRDEDLRRERQERVFGRRA